MQSDFWVAFTSKGARIYHGAEKPGQEEGSILLFNPDLKAVEGIPLHHWVLTHDAKDEYTKIVPMNENEMRMADAKVMSPKEPASVTAIGKMATYQEKINSELSQNVSHHGNIIDSHDATLARHNEALQIDEGLFGEIFQRHTKLEKTVQRAIGVGIGIVIVLASLLIGRSSHAAGNSPFIIDSLCTDSAFNIITQKCLNATGGGGGGPGPYLRLNDATDQTVTGPVYLGNSYDFFATDGSGFVANNALSWDNGGNISGTSASFINNLLVEGEVEINGDTQILTNPGSGPDTAFLVGYNGASYSALTVTMSEDWGYGDGTVDYYLPDSNHYMHFQTGADGPPLWQWESTDPIYMDTGNGNPISLNTQAGLGSPVMAGFQQLDDGSGSMSVYNNLTVNHQLTIGQLFFGSNTGSITFPNGGSIFDDTSGNLFLYSAGGSNVTTNNNTLDNTHGQILSVGDISSGTHFVAGQAQGGSLNLTSCGSSPTLLSGSNDVRGKITTGAGATSCQLNFYAIYGGAPTCMITEASATGVGLYVSAITTAHFIVSGTTVAGATFYYQCIQ